MNTLMLDFHDDPRVRERALRVRRCHGNAFASEQVEAGADMIGVGDAAASLIGPRLYEQFVLPYEKKLVAAIKAMGARVRLHICGNTRKILRGMGALGADMVDLDFPSPMAEGRAAMGPRQVLLGNLDPVRAAPRRHARRASPRCSTTVTRRPARATSSRPAARCRRARPSTNLQALTDFARSHQP